MRRRSPAPLWFQVAVAVAIALVLRALAPPAAADAPHCAFWALIAIVANAIWKAFEVAGKVTLTALAWAVKALQWTSAQIYNGLKAVVSGLRVGLKYAWEFLRATYEKVIKPAITKLWHWFEKFRTWLDKTFRPIIKHLIALRDALLKFYKTYIRPWIDLIDITRHTLKILSSLGLKWARALDARLGAIEDAIERPFLYVLAKVNEVINIVNRVVTLDGLIQRVALVGSLARDYKFAWQAIVNPYSGTIPTNERKAPAIVVKDARPDVVPGIRQYMRGDGGPDAATIRPAVAETRALLAGLQLSGGQ